MPTTIDLLDRLFRPTTGRLLRRYFRGQPVRYEGFSEADHPRGQPKNKGQFAAKGKATGSGSAAAPTRPAAAPTAKPAKKFGKSKAKVAYDKKAADKFDEVVGGDFDIDDAASAVGAPDDAEVTLKVSASGKSIEVNIQHKYFTAKRYLARDKNFDLYIKNDEFWMKEAAQGGGLGSEVFGRQLENARGMNIAYIKCHAAKDNPNNPAKPHNGFYTWPRLGYDQSIADLEAEAGEWSDMGMQQASRAALRGLKKNFPQAKSILDVMKTKEGQDWWKSNGCDLGEMKFDLTEGSRSLKTFEAYMEERASRPAKS